MAKFNYKQERINAKANRGKKLLRVLAPVNGHMLANQDERAAHDAERGELFVIALIEMLAFVGVAFVTPSTAIEVIEVEDPSSDAFEHKGNAP